MPMQNIDTDKIIPARFLKTIKRSGLGVHLFDPLRFDKDGNEKPDFVLNQEPYRHAQIIIAHENFGCGSSREHAPWALLDFGIRCIIAPDFADIFYNNSFKNGILPIRLPRAICDQLIDDAKLGGNARVTIDLARQVVIRPNGEEISFDIDPFRKHSLLNGLDDIGQTLQHGTQIDGFEARRRQASPGCRRPRRLTCRQPASPALTVATRLAKGHPDARQQEAADPRRRRHRPRGDARGPSRHRLDGPPPHGHVRRVRGPGRRRRDRHLRRADHRRHDAEGQGRRRHPVRFRWRPEMGQAGLRHAAGDRHPAPAQGTGPVRQPAPGDRAGPAGRCLHPEARRGPRPGPDDRARKHRRHLFRRAARRRDLPDGQQRGFDTETYTTSEIERVARVAFELARKRQNRVCSVEKANVMQSGLFWRQTVTALREREFADVELSHMYADNCAMQLVRNPRQFDVIVTSNMFGDLLSDLASMLTGSLGMLPSATLGAVQPSGKRHALYEPIHGSAPDIAGKGIANPLAQMLSFAMLLRYSFGMEEDAALIEQACVNVLKNGLRTADIMAPGTARVGTGVMGESILRELDKLAA